MGKYLSITRDKALKISFLAVSTAAIIEFTSGSLLNSLALISDAMHAFFDAFVTLILVITAKVSLRPADENHSYGHGKYEAIGGFIGGIILLIVAVIIGFRALERIIIGGKPLEPGFLGFSAVLYAFLIHLFRIFILNPGRFRESYTIKADFLHALSDLSSTAIAFIGLILINYNLKIGDAAAGLILSILLSFASLRLVWSTILDLSDTVPKSTYRKVLSTILRDSNIVELKSLKIRKIASKHFIEAIITLRSGLTFEKAHEVSMGIEESIRRVLGEAEVTIHMEPKDAEDIILKIKNVALEHDEVRDVHSIKTICTGGGMHVSLHVELDPEIPLEKAHEKAEAIEGRIREYIGKISTVTIHLEPSTNRVFREDNVKEDLGLVEAIRKMVLRHSEVRRIGRITAFTYMGRKYINISCSLNSNLKLSEAHSITTKIERDIKRKIRNSEITIHSEPYTNNN